MNKKTGIVLIFLLAISVFANVFAYVNREGTPGPAIGEYPQLKDASIIVGISRDGEVSFVNPGEKKFKRIRVGNERPFNIAKHLPGKIIKTIDNIVIFSGSPACAWHDGWAICDDPAN